MPLPAPSSTRSPRLAPLPEHCEAVLQLLGAPSPSWEEVTSLFLRDPVLTFSVFDAAPLEGQRLDATLRAEMARRLETLGADLARAWLLHLLWEMAPPSPKARDLAARALLVAECALHLALETRHPHPDEAYLAGLWHRLGEQCLAAGVAAVPNEVKALDAEADTLEAFPGPAPEDASALTSRLVSRCGVSGPLSDALTLQYGLDEQFLAAHPLVRLLWAARKLGTETWQAETDRVAQACGLTREAVLSLRTDVAFLAAAPTPAASGSSFLPGASAPAAGPGFDAMRDIALAGLVKAAFTPQEPDRWADRLALACYLLCAEPPPLVVVPDERELLCALPLTAGSNAPDWFGELALRCDDEASVIALCARSATVTSYQCSSGTPSRSPIDWHVARWLASGGIICLPLSVRARGVTIGAVAVHGVDERRPPAAATLSVLKALCTAAAQSALEADELRAARGALQASLENRFREHARRVVHEAGNPLAVIKNNLEIMARRHGDAGGGEMHVLHAELDRLGELLRQMGELPPERPEPLSCDVPRLLEELRVLYGEALFAKRGIRFDLRASEVRTPAAIPASALKQVLVNLFRNAAEALQPGGRFSVSVPGAVSWNGRPCLEIRLIDNGPGLPPDRVAKLFTAVPSDKGGEHQGLGLAIVREILEAWHASILCRSQANVGTSFQLFIPLENKG